MRSLVSTITRCCLAAGVVGGTVLGACCLATEALVAAVVLFVREVVLSTGCRRSAVASCRLRSVLGATARASRAGGDGRCFAVTAAEGCGPGDRSCLVACLLVDAAEMAVRVVAVDCCCLPDGDRGAVLAAVLAALDGVFRCRVGECARDVLIDDASDVVSTSRRLDAGLAAIVSRRVCFSTPVCCVCAMRFKCRSSVAVPLTASTLDSAYKRVHVFEC